MGIQDCALQLSASNLILSLLFIMAFAFSLLGNTIVIITILFARSRTRSITNFYLLNLAVADLFRSIVCIPSTLLSELTHCWLLGRYLCKILAYLQPVAVGASSYTLAIIAVERYFAICRPLESRKWHTKKRALVTISLVWALSFTANLGSLVIFDMVAYNEDHWTCDTTKGVVWDFVYQLYLTFVLLFIPLALMVGLYGQVIYALNVAINNTNPLIEQVIIEDALPGKITLSDWFFSTVNRMPVEKAKCTEKNSLTIPGAISLTRQSRSPSFSSFFGTPRGSFDNSLLLRSTNQDKILLAKRNVCRMLIILVIIFALCWVPSYGFWLLVRTCELMGINGVWHSGLNSVLTMLTYISSLANPITYCFMNKSFRTSIFSYCKSKENARKRPRQPIVSHRSFSRDVPIRDMAPIPLIKIDYAQENSVHV